MERAHARFRVGQPIRHKRFDYRGVVVDVDAKFNLSDEWYERMATSQPPKNAPWYHVLVHDSAHMTYVAERNMEPDLTGKPIENPEIERFFEKFENGLYVLRQPGN